MLSRELLDRITNLPNPEPGVAIVPPPELVAFTIAVGRGLRSWKKSTLADFAGVSLSTVERAERGEVVHPDSLDRISTALGYGAGYFTAPRCPISTETALEQMQETYGEMVAVEMAPLKTERQIRNLIRCHAYLPHCPELPAEFRPDVDGLVEWLDFAAFSTSDFLGEPRETAKRKLYRDILDFVRGLERSGLHVLAGIMEAPQPGHPDLASGDHFNVPESERPRCAEAPACLRRQTGGGFSPSGLSSQFGQSRLAPDQGLTRTRDSHVGQQPFGPDQTERFPSLGPLRR